MINPPRFLFIQINKRCNLRCEHCVFWQDNDDDKANYLSWPRKQEILREFSEMNPNGAVVICGGETMLALEDYFDITIECRKLGLTALSVINGTVVGTPKMADRMMTEGPAEVSVSLNSHRRELHDRTRGMDGSFEKATRALRLLLEARKRMPGCKTKIYVMGLIFDENFREIEQFYDFVLNEIGADKLKLNFLQPSFGGAKPLDHFFADHAAVDPDELLRIIDRCNEKYHLNLNPVWRAHVGMYFRSLAQTRDRERGWSSTSQTSEHICNTYERNIMVDHYGNARLCFSTAFRHFPLKRYGDLKKFWNGSNDIRAQMKKCNRFCGISHSVRREHSTLAPAAFARPPQNGSDRGEGLFLPYFNDLVRMFKRA
ncbi:MAG TPA: radical SAM protein [Verrucomicrobiae bacterium]|nr:radical SAM protein [Verrucomicrobiae bacterium]